MKKGIISILVICTVLLLTGCGINNKPSKLTCVQNGSNINIKVSANFLGTKIKNMSMGYDMNLSSYSDNVVNTLAKKDYCATVQSVMNQFTLVECKQSLDNKHIMVIANIDTSKIKETAPETVKANIEKDGYICTLE